MLKRAWNTPVRLGRWEVPWPLVTAALAVAYFAAARFGLKLATVQDNVSPVWPPSGLAMAALLLGGRRLWPGVALGAFVANALTPVPNWGAVAAGIAVGNTFEAVLGAWLAQRCLAALRGGEFNNVAEPAGFLLASLAAPAVSASCGVASLATGGAVAWSLAGTLWKTWWMGDALGAITIMPFLIALRDWVQSGRGWKAKDALRGAGLLAIIGGSAWVVFWQPIGAGWIFAILPVLLLAFAWFDSCGVKFAAVLFSAIAIAATFQGFGPFVGGETNANLLELQVFLGAVAITAAMLPVIFVSGSSVLPAIVLLSGWTVSGGMFTLLHHDEARRREDFFSERVAEAQAAIRVRMTSYVDAMRGGVSFFSASPFVDRDKWRIYAESLQVQRRYPGINSLGVVLVVKPAETTAWSARVRADGAGDVSIRPFPGTTEPGDDVKYLITYIESGDPGTIGRNIATDPSRRRAAELARDTGEPQLNHRLPGSRDTQRRSGLLLYVPLYAKSAPIESVGQRRVAHLGWVYAQIYPDVFLDGVLGPLGETLRLHFFEAGGMDRSRLLYASSGSDTEPEPRFERVTTMEMAGQTFQLGWRRGRKFPTIENSPAIWAASSFAVATLLMAGLVMSLHSVGRRANTLASERLADLTAAQDELRSINKTLEERVAARTSELQSANASLHFLADTMPQMVWTTRPDGVMESVNRGWLTYTGLTEEISLSEGWIRVLHPTDRAATATAWFDMLRTGREGCGEYRLRRSSDGEWRWHLWRAQPQRDEKGAIVRWVGTSTDIHDQKLAAEKLENRVAERTAELAASQQLFQRLFESAPDALVQCDRAGRIVRTNARAGALFGYTVEELVGQSVNILLPERDRPRHNAHMADYLGAPRAREMGAGLPLFGRRKNGSEFPVDIMLSPLQGDAGLHALAVIRDITERKQLEENLARARDQALESSRLKSEFLATMSHEIRTPMNGVIGMAELLASTKLDGEQLDMVQLIQNQADGLLAIINDVLDFSKIEAGMTRITPEEFDLRKTITDTAALFTLRAQEKQLAFGCEIDARLSGLFSGDPGRVRQVIVNLVANALKFTEHGSVALHAEWLRETDTRTRFRVSVRDTGIGIPASAHGRLFQPFTQVDGSAARRFGGTGLGLAISRQLVELMGGKIGFNSEPGQGSTFWFELELARVIAHSSRAQPAANGSGEHRSLRILVAEDNPAGQTVARLSLSKLGHVVEIADNGHLVIERLAAGNFDVVLMDCQMPHLDGYETTRRIRAGKTPGVDPRIPIIALTAYAMADDRKKCLEAGMDDYVAKPLRPQELLAALDRCCGSGANAAPDEPGTNGMDSGEPLDLAQVERLRALRSPANGSVLHHAISITLRETPERLATLRTLVARQEAADFATLAHTLAGSCANLGALSLRNLAGRAERAAEAGDWREVAAQVTAIEREWSRVEAALRRLLADSHA